MKRFNYHSHIKIALLLVVSFCWTIQVWAQAGVFPKPMNPPRLVNDFAQLLSPTELDQLEQKVLDYNNTTSIEIAIVTVNSLQGYEVADYTIQLANQWKIGKKDKNNGVLILVSKHDRKMFIASGYGMEGVLTDALSGRIYRNEMTPEFRNNNYYQGLLNAVNAIVAVSKNEYTADEIVNEGDDAAGIGAIFMVIFIIIFILILAKGKGGGGNGTYMSRRGSDILTGAILGELLSGGRGGGSSWGGGGGFGGGGGGFGGFGGGSFGGGGAGGSW